MTILQKFSDPLLKHSAFDIVLPYPHPSIGQRCSSRFSPLVRFFHMPHPIIYIRFRSLIMKRATMPKATINKKINRFTLSAENLDIGFSFNLWVHSVGDARFLQPLVDYALYPRRLVYLGHNLATFFPTENICQGSAFPKILQH